MNGDITVRQSSEAQVRGTHKLEPDRNNLLIVFGLITIISGTIATALLFSRVGYTSLACAGAGLLIGGALITTSFKRVAKTNLEKSKDSQKESPPPPQRMEISLPVGVGLYSKQQWEEIGVEFIDALSDDSVQYVKAKLPAGWRPTIGMSAGLYFLLNEKSVPVVRIYYRKSEPQKAKVDFLSEEEQQKWLKEARDVLLEVSFRMVWRDYIRATLECANERDKELLPEYTKLLLDFVRKNPEFKNKLPDELINLV